MLIKSNVPSRIPTGNDNFGAAGEWGEEIAVESITTHPRAPLLLVLTQNNNLIVDFILFIIIAIFGLLVRDGGHSDCCKLVESLYG